MANTRATTRAQATYAAICAWFLTWLEADLGRPPTTADFTLEAAVGWLEYRATSGGPEGRGVAAGTLLVNRSVLRQLALAADRPGVAAGLAAFRPQLAPPAVLLPAQYERLLQAPDRRNWLGARDYTILRLLGDVGVSVDQLCSLRVGDVAGAHGDRTPGTLHLADGTGRRVPLAGPAAAALAAWLVRHPNGLLAGGRRRPPPASAPLFIRAGGNGTSYATSQHPHGVPIRENTIRRMLNRRAREAGLPTQLGHPHVLAYYWASSQMAPEGTPHRHGPPAADSPLRPSRSSRAAPNDARAELPPDLVNAAEIERRQYGRAVDGRRILKLARNDPNFPPPLPTAGREKLWSWALQIRPYFDPSAEPPLVTAAEIARRAVAYGYRKGMTRRRVLQIAREDPNFPPALPSAGTEKLWWWPQVEPYLQTHDSTPTRGRFGPRRRVPGAAVDPSVEPPPAGPDGKPDLVNATEAARRAVAEGLAPTMSRQRIWVLINNDPEAPEPWPTGGYDRLWSWSLQMRPYLAARAGRPMRGRFSR